MTRNPPRQWFSPTGASARLTKSHSGKYPVSESFAGKIGRLFALLKRRPARREIVLPPFHPIIFANGRDDDGPGLKAFYEGRPVMCHGREIGPGDRTLRDLSISLSCVAIHFRRSGEIVETIGYPARRGGILVIDVQPGTRRMMSHCTLLFGLKVEP